MTKQPIVKNWYDGPSVGFDFDGVITEGDLFPATGIPNQEIVELMRQLRYANVKVIVYTSRPHAYFQEIEAFLNRNDIYVDQIITAGKPNVDVYIDDRGLFPPGDVLEAYIVDQLNESPHYDLAGSLKSLWDRQQRNVPENPKYHHVNDPCFRVIVPVSGGLDSSTAYKLALDTYESKYVVPVYVNYGQSAAMIRMEMEAFESIFNFTPASISLASPLTETSQHIVYGRNREILLAIAEFAKKAEWWADIWFGNLGGETPINEGDKSSRFLLTLQQMMTLKGMDSRVVSPFQALDKPDLVKFWQYGEYHKLFAMKTCFSDHSHRCSACQTCFRMFAALVECGIDPNASGELYHLDDLKPFAEKYAAIIKSGEWPGRYSYRRVRGMFVALSRILGEGWQTNG